MQLSLFATDLVYSIGDDELAISTNQAIDILKKYNIPVSGCIRNSNQVVLEGEYELMILKIADPDELENVTGCGKEHLPEDYFVIIILGLSEVPLDDNDFHSLTRELAKINVVEGDY